MTFATLSVYKKTFINLSIAFVAGLVFLGVLDMIVFPLYTRGGTIVQVPNVVGLTWEQAEKRLHTSGLEAMKGYSYHDAHKPVGVVLFQNPLFETEVKSGRHVYVSLNIETAIEVTVPNLVGKKQDEVYEKLKENQLELGDVIEETVSDMSSDKMVLWQSIAPKKNVKKDTKVHIRIGKLEQEGGDNIVMVPDIAGMSLEQAKLKLKITGFNKIVVNYSFTKKFTENTVVYQNPKKKEKTKVSREIILTVSTSDRTKVKTN